MASSPHPCVSSSSQDASLFLRAGPDPQAPLGIPGIGRTQVISNGAPMSLPRVHSAFPSDPLEGPAVLHLAGPLALG